MADEVARLRIEAATDDLAVAAQRVDKLRAELENAKKAVDQTQPGWEKQAAAVEKVTAKLAEAERALKRREIALKSAQQVAENQDAADAARAQRANDRAEREARAAERKAEREAAAADRRAAAEERAAERAAAAAARVATSRNVIAGLADEAAEEVMPQLPGTRRGGPGDSTPAAGRRMDAGRTSMFGFNLANTLQDAAYNPAYAVNNVMFMAQQSGGIKELGKDLKEFTVVAAAAAAGGIKSLPSLIASAGTAAVAGGVALAGLGGVLLVTHKGLKDAGLGWSDFMDVMANSKPVQGAVASVEMLGDVAVSTWEILEATPIGAIAGSTKEAAHWAANLTLGWDAATEAVKRNKEITEEGAKAAADWAEKLKQAAAELKGVQSEEQKTNAQKGAELIQDLANMGGAKGLEGTIAKIAALGMVDEAGAPVDAERLRVDMAAAKRGDADAMGRVRNFAGMAELDLAKPARDRETAMLNEEGAKNEAVALRELEQAKKEKEQARKDAEKDRAGAAANTFAGIRGDLEKDLAAVRSGEEFALVMDRLNDAFRKNLLSEEDYASVLERANGIKQQAAENEERAAKAAREKANATLERRVDRAADLYGGAFGGGLTQAMLRAANRGESAEDVDARLRTQLRARMQYIPDNLREGVITQMLERSRMQAQDFVIMRGFQGDVMGAQLGAMGNNRTFMGVAARQQAARMANMLGIDQELFRREMGAAAPGKAAEKNEKAAQMMWDAAQMMQRLQVVI